MCDIRKDGEHEVAHVVPYAGAHLCAKNGITGCSKCCEFPDEARVIPKGPECFRLECSRMMMAWMLLTGPAIPQTWIQTSTSGT